MRGAFFDALLTLAERDHRVNLIVGDLGFGVAEQFARRFPERFLNAGIAEQNMTGIAAGMALSGRIVFTYSIANFPILRCLEQVRNDVCYHNANVKIVAVGGGLAYGSLGSTHHATEDLAIMRSLPRMTVVAPADPVEAGAATRAVAARPGPCYLRLGRAGEAKVHRGPIDFQLGKAIQVSQGSDLSLISTGGMLETAVQIAESLHHAGLQTRVLSMHTVKPLDADAILAAARETGAVFTLEEHSVDGGLGGAVAELLAEAGAGTLTFRRFGLPSAFSPVVGTQEYLRAQHGLTAKAVASAIASILEKDRTFAATCTG
jgi:transketolase